MALTLHVMTMDDGSKFGCVCSTGHDHGEDEMDQP